MIKKDKPLLLTEAEIAAWEEKDKHRRKVKKLEYAGDGDNDAFYVVPPDRATTTMIAEMSREGKIGKINDILINSCVLAGSMESLEWDDALYYGLIRDITELGEVKKSI